MFNKKINSAIQAAAAGAKFLRNTSGDENNYFCGSHWELNGKTIKVPEKITIENVKRLLDILRKPTKNKIISVDAETDGLWGNAFAIAAIVYERKNGKWIETGRFVSRIPNSFVSNTWVQENVLPTLERVVLVDERVVDETWPHVTHEDGSVSYRPVYGGAPTTTKKVEKVEQIVPITHQSIESMLQDFAKWYLENKHEADIVCHMGTPVEAGLFISMRKFGFIGDWDAPYPLIDVSGQLQMIGEDPTSVDNYAKKHDLSISDYGTTHNPLYDCEVSAKCYIHILGL